MPDITLCLLYVRLVVTAGTLQIKSMPDITLCLLYVRLVVTAGTLQIKSMPDISLCLLYVRLVVTAGTLQIKSMPDITCHLLDIRMAYTLKTQQKTKNSKSGISFTMYGHLSNSLRTRFGLPQYDNKIYTRFLAAKEQLQKS